MASLPEFTVSNKDNTTIICLIGKLDAKGASSIWQDVIHAMSAGSTANLILDLEKLTYLDTAGATLIHHMEMLVKNLGIKEISIVNLKPEHLPLVDLAKTIKLKNIYSPLKKLSFVENKGKKLSELLSETTEFITYTGEITWALIQSLIHPKKIRWSDTLQVAERAGVDALPIVALISFIVGLVMAFQAAIPMRMFGAELYVADLIGIAMVRELGPLMTAIILAGRSGSAFAAEIGTMRINEEIDALTVMGINPIRFLIVPRIIASTIMTPLLTIFSNLVGMLGGALVITSMGYPIISYYNQIVSFVTWIDFAGGLIKCFVFGILIAATGCIRGYQTQSGPSAVGISTTRAVVTGIILIAVFDGIFSIIYYTLGI
ncbi:MULTISPECIES: MlaE family lipid ABC transporter permease subunit [Desulfobacula]|uniref:Predicted sulfate ABC transporter, permease protein n=2 Tax=Desulfobacula TaxID=28222 RepID=K0NKD5_DESTT|nr:MULTISPECIES: MlaE family lipid ABC transporter permease subunit [Desulfobacula]CCK82016.1 predicted sulfate ABC transporter, permease protein [Desulfobacula toluolica Tol2]SDU43818.1 phospholipid/cholesterol/gamma-HCH transport system permease protein [Desulfobacula phenolica]